MIMINDEDDDDDINDDTDDDSKDKDYKNTLCSMSGGELFNRIQERQSFNERGGIFTNHDDDDECQILIQMSKRKHCNRHVSGYLV